MYRLTAFLFLGLVAGFTSLAHSQAPELISFQGYLTNPSGTPISGTHDLTFSIHSAFSGGIMVWSETIEDVFVQTGVFDVVLGEGGSPPMRQIWFTSPMWLQINVDGENVGARMPLTSAPYALGLRGLRVMPNADPLAPPSLAGGYQSNEILSPVRGGTIGGGGDFAMSNRVGGDYGTIGGGRKNLAGFYTSGGLGNHPDATVGGGRENVAVGESGVVGGGYYNRAWDEMTTVAGGEDNEAGSFDADGSNGSHAAVGGGDENKASGRGSTIAGGSGNTANEDYSTIGGGVGNDTNGRWSTIPGGRHNITDGSYSFAAGWQAEAAHNGTFVWADSTDEPLGTTGDNQFLVRASGGVGIGTNAPAGQLHVVEGGTRSAVYVEGDYAGGIPGATMRVYNNSTSAGVTGYFESSGTDATFIVKNTSTGSLLKAYTGGNLRFLVDNAGDVYADGTFNPSGADLAESFNVEGSASAFTPGDVLVISDDIDYAVGSSNEPYSTRIAGVYATRPGVLLAPESMESENDDRIPLGVVGVIPTKVCDEGGPISRGDLLVSSSRPGHAMKADPARLGFGMVLGKALEEFRDEEAGVIRVLVNVR
jgi:hypothetical protein